MAQGKPSLIELLVTQAGDQAGDLLETLFSNDIEEKIKAHAIVMWGFPCTKCQAGFIQWLYNTDGKIIALPSDDCTRGGGTFIDKNDKIIMENGTYRFNEDEDEDQEKKTLHQWLESLE
jgi:hypothetical protein